MEGDGNRSKMVSKEYWSFSRASAWLLWMPNWVRWDPEANHDLTWAMNVLFGLTATFSVANLYYAHPILNILAEEFGVSDQQSSLIATMLQAGYAGGLLFIIPLGDIIKRRPFILSLIFVTAMLWLGCTITRSFPTFLALSFLVGALTVTPQLMFPLAVQYAPERHRATMISIVMTGLVFGILVARLLSGVVTEYTSWRNMYWLAFGLQMSLFILIFFFLPDYPVLRPGTSYSAILWTIVKLPFFHPVLIQNALIGFLVDGLFTSFWTTLTFQLANVFNLNPLMIGLFSLIGILPVFLVPLISWLFISRIHPSGTLLIAHVITLLGICMGTFIGTYSLAGPVIWVFLGDLGINAIVVGNRMAIAEVDTNSQNAVNAVYMVFSFCGQLFGTATGNALYANGGWTCSGILNIVETTVGILIIVLRGPHEKGWIGWGGGWNLKYKGVVEKKRTPGVPDVEANDSMMTSGLSTGVVDQMDSKQADCEKKVL